MGLGYLPVFQYVLLLPPLAAVAFLSFLVPYWYTFCFAHTLSYPGHFLSLHLLVCFLFCGSPGFVRLAASSSAFAALLTGRILWLPLRFRIPSLFLLPFGVHRLPVAHMELPLSFLVFFSCSFCLGMPLSFGRRFPIFRLLPGQLSLHAALFFCLLPLACSLWLAASYTSLAVRWSVSSLSLVFSPGFRLQFFTHPRLIGFPHSAFWDFHYLLLPSFSVWIFRFLDCPSQSLSPYVSTLPCLPLFVAGVRPQFSFLSSSTTISIVLRLCVRSCPSHLHALVRSLSSVG